MVAFAKSLAKAVVTKIEDVLSRTSLTGTAFDVTAYEGTALILLEAGASTAGTATLDVKIQHSATSGGSYVDVPGATFAQVTAAASQQAIQIDLDKVNGFIKVVATFGASNALPFGLTFIGYKKYS